MGDQFGRSRKDERDGLQNRMVSLVRLLFGSMHHRLYQTSPKHSEISTNNSAVSGKIEDFKAAIVY